MRKFQPVLTIALILFMFLNAFAQNTGGVTIGNKRSADNLYNQFIFTKLIRRCVYEVDFCLCCEWSNTIFKHFKKSGLITDDKPYDLYLAPSKFLNRKNVLFVLAPKFGVGLHGRNFGCSEKLETHKFDCFSKLGFKAYYAHLEDGKLNIEISTPTNGFIYGSDHNPWVMEDQGKVYRPLFCIEDELGKARFYFTASKNDHIKIVEYNNDQKCNEFPYKDKVAYFNKTYSGKY